MKIKIGNYPTHRWYHNFLYKLGIKNEPKVSVHIDDFDTWSMDHTLAYIIDANAQATQRDQARWPVCVP